MSLVLRLSLVWMLLAAAACGPRCLLAGTLVETPQGSRRIESLRIGDRIVSDGGESRVVAVRRHRSAAFMDVTLDDGTRLRVTGSHPLATRAGWRAVRRLRVGDVVRTRDGSARITGVRRVRKSVDVYDLTVVPYENFFADTVLVHNKSRVPPPDPEELVGAWVAAGPHGGGYQRLELRSDGTGTLVEVLGGWGPRVSRVKWSLQEYTLSIHAQPLDGSAKAFTMKGWYRHLITLETESGLSYSLQREEGWRDMEQRAERALRELYRR